MEYGQRNPPIGVDVFLNGQGTTDGVHVEIFQVYTYKGRFYRVHTGYPHDHRNTVRR